MKNNIIFTILLHFNLFFAQDNFQHIEAIYELNYKISKKDTTDVKTEDFLFRYNNGISLFNSLNSSIGDSITKVATSIADVYKVPKTKFKYTIEKNTTANLMVYYQKMGIDKFKYIDSLPLLKWELIDEEKKTGNFTCKKATVKFAGRNYIAWYSLDIPISDGPYKFYGLPGLIFQIYDTSNNYNFSLKNIKTINKEPVFDKSTYKELKKADFFVWIDTYKNNPDLLLKNGPIQLSTEDMKRVRQKYFEKAAYENNPIELTD